MPEAQQLWAVIWGLGVGLAFLVAIYVGVASGWFRKAVGRTVPETDPLPESATAIDEYPDGLAEGHSKVPVLLKLVIVGYVVFLVAYVAIFLRAS